MSQPNLKKPFPIDNKINFTTYSKLIDTVNLLQNRIQYDDNTGDWEFRFAMIQEAVNDNVYKGFEVYYESTGTNTYTWTALDGGYLWDEDSAEPHFTNLKVINIDATTYTVGDAVLVIKSPRMSEWFIVGGAGGTTTPSDTAVIKIVSGTGTIHYADVWKNGKPITQTADETNIEIRILQVSGTASVPPGTYLFATKWTWMVGDIPTDFYTADVSRFYN